ncbi:MAG: hypothetical protein LBU09_00990 [Endomicrobium sp.]|jgi:hypothetical protein|nr:hypothetical protein [Endomicrobium sp.]
MAGNSKTIYISPKLKGGDLKAMQRELTKAFNSVNKTYESGFRSVLRRSGGFFARTMKSAGRGIASGIRSSLGGSLFGMGMMLTSGILQNFDKADGVINNYLKKADAVATQASAFGSTNEQMKDLLDIGELKGIDNQAMLQMLMKMSDIRAREKEEKGSSGFGVKEEHLNGSIYDSFMGTLGWLQELYKKDKNEATEKFSQVFGFRLAGRGLELLQNPYQELKKDLTPVVNSNEKTDSLAAKEEQQTLDRINRERDAYNEAALKINDDVIKAQSELENKKLEKSLALIDTETYKDVAAANEAKEEITTALTKGAAKVFKWGKGVFSKEEKGYKDAARNPQVVREIDAEIAAKRKSEDLQKIANSQKRIAETNTGIQ